MTETSPAPAPAAPPEPVARLHDELDRLQKHQRVTQLLLIALSLLLLLSMLAFAWGLYNSVTSNLSVEKLQPVLMERVDARTPELQRKATEAVTLAMPTYQELGRARLAEVTPKLRKQLQEELDRLPDAVQERLDGRLTGLQERIEEKATARIQERFGDIPPEKVSMLADRFSDAVLDSGGRIQSDLEDKYSQQANRLQNVLEKFDVPETQGLTDGELQLKVIENAALLVVYLTRNPDELPTLPDLPLGEIMPGGESGGGSGGGEDPAGSSASTPDSPRTATSPENES